MATIVTGALGCIGAWVVKNLLDAGEAVVAFDAASDTGRLRLVATGDEIARVSLVTGDVADVDALRGAMQGSGATRVIHLAALQVPACRTDPIRGAQVNVLGTLAVFEAAKKERIRRVVYASSAAVLGPPEDYPDGRADDGAPTGPRTLYGAFKAANELCARVYFESDGISSVGLRPWAVYGPGRDFGLTSAPTLAMQAAVLGHSYRIPFGGRCDLQFVDDVAKAFVASASPERPGARVHNLRGEVVTMDDVVRAIEGALPEARGLVTHGDDQLPIAFDLDDGAFRAEVKGVPRTRLADGVRRTIDVFSRLMREGRLPPVPA